MFFLILFCFFFFSPFSDCSKLKLTDFPKITTREENSKFRLFCLVEEGHKPFQFEWFWNGKLIRENSKILIQNNEESSMLSIERLNRSDSGEYSCNVTNSGKKDSQFTVLNVKGLLNINCYFGSFDVARVPGTCFKIGWFCIELRIGFRILQTSFSVSWFFYILKPCFAS